MSTERESTPYFDPPARHERMQLLQHLLRNAEHAVYLRAPAGAGKTRFAAQLAARLRDGFAVVCWQAGDPGDPLSVLVEQLDLVLDASGPLDAALPEALGDLRPVLIVDRADQLDESAIGQLGALLRHGCRLLLVGRGGLPATDGWRPQFIDLPPFDAADSAAFLRQQATAFAVPVSDAMAAALHKAAQGWPGPLLDAAQAWPRSDASAGRPAPAAVGVGAVGAKSRLLPPGTPRWPYVAGGFALLVLGSVLVFQDDINRLFESPSKVAVGHPAQVGVIERPSTPAAPSAPAIAVPDRPLPPTQPVSQVAPQPLPDVRSDGDVADALATGAADDDPLEAVMRDALAAAALAAAPQAESAPPSAAASGEPGAATGRLADTVLDPAPADGPAETPAERHVEPGVRPAATVSDPPQPADIAPEQAATEPEQAVTEPAMDEAAATGPESVAVGAQRAAEPAAKAAARPHAEPRSPGPVQNPSKHPQRGEAWLRGRDPGRYTLQLVGARDRDAIEKFVREQRIQPPYAVFERSLDGRPWFSLVAGDYPDRGSALAARDRLPRALVAAGVWPRTFDTIQKGN